MTNPDRSGLEGSANSSVQQVNNSTTLHHNPPPQTGTFLRSCNGCAAITLLRLQARILLLSRLAHSSLLPHHTEQPYSTHTAATRWLAAGTGWQQALTANTSCEVLLPLGQHPGTVGYHVTALLLRI
jgi:hypothetical protein